MKKTVQLVVSILLVIVILGSICWYLLEYDPDFTRDFILKQASHLDDMGHNAAAVWLYDFAYRQADQDDYVAIELAEYYKSIGNYSKAEYTLTKAIEDGGSAELYVALCRTFVEQDKLRDAVMMLDKVSDPTVKAQLSSMRPAAPTASHPAGYYTEYIQVSISSGDAQLYISTDSDYPSTSSGAVNGSFTLSGGETTLYVVAIGENGMVSPLSVFHYTVSDVVEPVVFTDSAVEQAVRAHLGVSQDQVIYSDTLWSITDFTMPSSAITAEDLHWMPNLVSLNLSGCAFEELQVLSVMSRLEKLTITDCVVSVKDLQIIASLPRLTSLTLSNCYLTKISNLADATGLTYLDLSGNSIRDISPLQGMTQLQQLYLQNNVITSMEPLSGLTELHTLNISYNYLVTVAPVASLTNLTWLDISANGPNGLMKLEGIDALEKLRYFAASYNNLVDVDLLASCTQLQTLIISHNTLLNIDVLASLPQLQTLDFSYNEISTLPKFSGSSILNVINGGYNQISSLDRLAGLAELEYVYMDQNSGIKNIDKLVACPKLKVVNVYGSGVRSAYKLTSRGITVYYTPV